MLMLGTFTALVLCATPADQSSMADALARGDIVAAIDALRDQKSPEAKLVVFMLTPRYAWQDYPGRPKVKARGPLPTIPPERPAEPGKAAFVNVATAYVRSSPAGNATRAGQLAIGSQVFVEKFEGMFARVKGDGLPQPGYVHRDLLSAKAPTVDGLLAQAAQLAAKGPDFETMLLWRAYNLDPDRTDVLAKLSGAAMRGGRPTVVIDAVALALQRGKWLTDSGKLRTIADVRNYLYRACMLRRMDLVAPLLEHVSTTQDLGAHGQVSEAEFLRVYFERDGDGVIFQLSDAVLARGSHAGDTWSSNTGEASVSIRQKEGRVTITGFHLEPAECDWELLRGERTDSEPCKALHSEGEERDEPAEPAPTEPRAAPPRRDGQ